VAKTQKPIKRSDGHTQKYTVGSDKTVPLAGSAVPSAHATSAASASFDAPAAEAEVSDPFEAPESVTSPMARQALRMAPPCHRRAR